MSGYVVKLRGSPSALIASDYECPEHGHFDAIVARDQAAVHPCPACGATSDRRLSSPMLGREKPTVVRGNLRPERRPTDMNTEAIGLDGQDEHDYRDRRKAMWFAHDMDEAKRKGLV